MATGTIQIDQNYCKGCNLCAYVCAKQLIRMDKSTLNAAGYHPAVLLDPELRCTGCGLCAVVCPEVCITVYRTSPLAKPTTMPT